MAPRSSRADVRNPLLALPAVVAAARRLTTPERDYIRTLLVELSADARVRAEKAWRTHKGPMAVYWKSIAVYARHAARAIPCAQ